MTSLRPVVAYPINAVAPSFGGSYFRRPLENGRSRPRPTIASAITWLWWPRCCASRATTWPGVRHPCWWSVDVLAPLNETATRIESIGRLHRLLADAGDGALIDVGAYMREIANS